MKALPLALVLLVSLAATAAARNIYVNNVTGEDAHDGHFPRFNGGRGGPVRTIARALAVAHRGDHVVLANTGEPYRESVTLFGGNNSGYFDSPFTIHGNGAILDGSRPVLPQRWEHVRGETFRFRPRRLGHHQLFVDGLPLVRLPVQQNDWRLPDLGPLEWALFDGQIYFRTERGRTPRSYAISHAGAPVGVTLYRVEHVVIFDLVVQGFQLDGINAFNVVRDCTLAGVASRGNGRSGVSVGGSSVVRIQACTLHQNGVAQLRTEAQARANVFASRLEADSAPPWQLHGGHLLINGQPATTAGP